MSKQLLKARRAAWAVPTAVVLSCACLIACGGGEHSGGAVAAESAPMQANDVQQLGNKVADWQIKSTADMSYLPGRYLASSYNRGWVKGAWFIGVDRFASVTQNTEYQRYLDQESLDNGYELGHRYWHGDDQIMGIIYANIAEREGKPELLKFVQEDFDRILEDRSTVSLEFVTHEKAGMEGTCQRRWCWADAIFMAPPSWVRVADVTGETRYLDYAVEEAKATIEYLFDHDLGLMYRDSRYFDQKTENGHPVMWSRGNGWVFAGLARFIEVLPADHPERDYFIGIYTKMAEALLAIQRDDGYWPTSLLDDALFTNPETSGTGFFTFGLLWGINEGILAADTYEAAALKGWSALVAATNEDGRVGWVQQIGKDPQATSESDSQLYGVGGFLLSAAEMIRRDQK